jgi:hypothetical protein
LPSYLGIDESQSRLEALNRVECVIWLAGPATGFGMKPASIAMNRQVKLGAKLVDIHSTESFRLKQMHCPYPVFPAAIF